MSLQHVDNIVYCRLSGGIDCWQGACFKVINVAVLHVTCFLKQPKCALSTDCAFIFYVFPTCPTQTVSQEIGFCRIDPWLAIGPQSAVLSLLSNPASICCKCRQILFADGKSGTQNEMYLRALATWLPYYVAKYLYLLSCILLHAAILAYLLFINSCSVLLFSIFEL